MTDIEQTIEDEVEEEPQPVEAGVGDAPDEDELDASAGPEAGVRTNEAEEADEVEGDLQELLEKAAQRDEYLALAQRTQADFENYRKRVARDSAMAHERGVVKLAKELLPALDSLDRALEGAAQDDPLLDGVRLVRSELGAALARVGVEAFTPVGEPFDPTEHEAVAQQPVEGAESGTVAEVYQTGYRSGGNVIRPARVLVAA
ncbi:MAG: nucleotide exchange factor GrpE [Solirubrobacterales bacterium]